MEAATARRVLVLVNPTAGAGRSGRLARNLVGRLRNAGLDLEVAFTESPDDAHLLARTAIEEGRRDLVAAGGDGTAFQVADGALAAARDRGVTPRLGVLPLGTGNALVDHHLALDRGSLRRWERAGSEPPRSTAPRSLADFALAGILEGRRRPLDVLLVEHAGGELHALSTVTLALPTAVASTVNRFLKPLRGAAYHLGALLETARLRAVPFHAELEIGDRSLTIEGPSPLVAIQNLSTFGRGMRIAPMARGDDGLAELVLAGPIGRLDLLRTLPKVYHGGHLDHPALRVERFRRLRVLDPVPQPVMVDGEVLDLELRSVRVLPAALELML